MSRCLWIFGFVVHASAQSRGPLEVFRHGVDARVAPDTRGQLDDWTLLEPGDLVQRAFHHVSFVLVLLTIGAGVAARVRGLVPRARADVLRTICFMCLLPAFLLRHIWLCQLDSSLYAVAAWSTAVHGLWFLCSARSAQVLQPRDAQQRGWTMLMSQGAMNSFLYPLLLRSPGFGEKSLACAVLWDLGGNMWTCQFALFAIAAYFKPKRRLDDLYEVELRGDEEEEGNVLLPKSLAHKHDLLMQHFEAAGVPREIVADAIRQPVLLACIAGFLCNLLAVPLPAMADTPLWIVGEPYKLALYFLVGYYGDHNLAASDLGLLGQALGVRYAISVLLILGVLIFLPFDHVYRYTVALSLLSPTSSYLIYLVGENGYGERLMRLTICGGFISTLVSTISQSLFIEMLSTSAG